MAKLAAVVALLAATLMAAMIFEAVKRELNLRQLKQRMAQDVSEVKRKEAAIVGMKAQIQELRDTLSPLNARRDEMLKRKQDLESEKVNLGNDVQACSNEKAEADKKKAEATEKLNKVKWDFEEEKKKAQQEIQALKQNILDRDKAICAFIDQTNQEARKLCGISEAAR